MPIFAMSIFLLPRGVCDSIENIMNRFWWESWARLAWPKYYSGMGFKRLHEFNITLLAKQGWRVLTNPDSLDCKILKARYFPNDTFLIAKLGYNPSFIWRRILARQMVLRERVVRRVGNGSDTLVWGWPWLVDSADWKLQTVCIDELQDAKVSNLLTSEGEWGVELIRDIFSDNDVKRILSTPIPPLHNDSWCWKGDVRGQYTVKHGYHLLTATLMIQVQTTSFVEWRWLWSLSMPSKVNIFI